MMRILPVHLRCLRTALVLSLACCVPACDADGPNAVYELLALRTEIQENCAAYSQSDWADAAGRYGEICERLEHMPLTREERIEIDKVKGEIAGRVATMAVRDVSDCVRDVIDEVTSFAEGFSETFQIDKLFRSDEDR